jgi:hypothetical protein
MVMNYSPAIIGANYPAADNIMVLFTEAVRPSTVNDNTVKVLRQSDNAAVAGTVAYDTAARAAVFTPASRLDFVTDYRVDVTTGVRDLAGNAMAREVVSPLFTTQGPGPSVTALPATSVRVDRATLNGKVNPIGDGTTAWFEFGTDPGFSPSTYKATTSRSVGVGTAVLPFSDNVSGLLYETPYYFRLAGTNSLGTQWSDVGYFTLTSGWGTPSLVEIDNDRKSYLPKIAVDRNGNAAAIWLSDFGASGEQAIHPMVWGANYSSATGLWGAPVNFQVSATDNGGIVPGSLSLAMDDAGNAFAAWYQSNALIQGASIWARRFDAAAGTWGASVSVKSVTSSASRYMYLGYPVLAVDGTGNAMIAWYASDSVATPTSSIDYSYWSSGSGAWSAPLVIQGFTSGSAGIGSYDLAFDRAGNSFAALFLPDNAVRSRHYNIGTGLWGSLKTLKSVDPVNLAGVTCRIGFGSGGEGLALWSIKIFDGFTYYDNVYWSRF